MINVIVLKEEGIIVVEPVGPLKKADFDRIAEEIDAYPDDNNGLTGLIIHTELFPGWDDFTAFLQHMRFIKGHHKVIQYIAIVTDSKLGSIGPAVVNVFVSATVKHFRYDKIMDAKQWMKTGS